MQLKANTFYKRKDGGKAYCHGQSPFLPDRWRIEPEKGGIMYYALADGTAPIIPHADLVEEWREPRKIKVHVYETKEGVLLLYDRESPIKSDKLVAMTEVTEGEGL